MKSIHRISRNGVAIERVEFFRASFKEAQEIKDNLLDDIDCKKIIVDLSSCNYIDSTFLGAMVFAYRALRHQGCALVLVIEKDLLAKSFLYAELTSIFNIYHSLNEAMETLNHYCEKVSKSEHERVKTILERVKFVRSDLMENPG